MAFPLFAQPETTLRPSLTAYRQHKRTLQMLSYAIIITPWFDGIGIGISISVIPSAMANMGATLLPVSQGTVRSP